MAHIFVGIGSNIKREKNIIASINELKKNFGDLTVSRVFESEAVGFKGNNFYNLVVEFYSDLPVQALISTLKQIETNLGRSKNKTKDKITVIDLDLLLYDQIVDEKNNIPRAEIIENAFVLRPLAELAKHLKHPVLQESFQDLWGKYAVNKQHLKEITLSSAL